MDLQRDTEVSKTALAVVGVVVGIVAVLKSVKLKLNTRYEFPNNYLGPDWHTHGLLLLLHGSYSPISWPASGKMFWDLKE